MATIHNNSKALVKTHWSDEQKKHAELALHFIQHVMNEHDFETIRKMYASAPYIQHNRSMEDGIEGVLQAVAKLSKRFPDFAYDVKNIMVDGDYVTVHAHATVNRKHRGNERKGFNIIDTWRVKDGRLVEHWDAVQPLDAFMRMYYWLTGGSIMNSNGVF